MSPRRHRLLFTITGTAFLLRLLVPSGYMPASVDSGWPLQLCGNGIPAAVMAHLTGAHHHHHAHNHAHGGTGSKPEHCDLGGGFAADTVLASMEVDDAAPPAALMPLPLPRVPGQSSAYPAQQPRAPPAAA